MYINQNTYMKVLKKHWLTEFVHLGWQRTRGHR